MTLQELFNNPENWTQGTFAKWKLTKERIECRLVPKTSINSCCFCLLGGINICYKPHMRPIIEQKLTAYIQTHTDFPNIPTFNDSPLTTIQDIQKVVKECDV